jgi:sugar O-acyltransferase (sialic acid O-acetyltransferase NeuD family)
MKDKLLIIGASGHGKVVADIALKMNQWNSIAFLDDNKNLNESMGYDVIGRTKDAFNLINDYAVFIGIGNNDVREKYQIELENAGAVIPTLIHPNAVIGKQVDISSGTVIMPGVVINCCTTIGKGCIINTASTVDHDNIIEDYVHLSPGTHTAGTVRVGKGTWIGIGSVVSNNLKIAKNCTIGAGSVVVKDIVNSGTYVGVPARRVKH